MTRIILTIAACVALALGGWRLFVYVDESGYERGRLTAQGECKQASLEGLTAVIDSAAGLTADAHSASKAINKSIADRQQADRQTTRDLRHALKLTAPDRAGCVYDADSMRHINTARDRAAEAVTSGLGGAMPDAGDADGKSR